MNWLDMTWTQIAKLDKNRTVLILPVGAVEAHGPHLPLGTDGIISLAMAQETVRQLRALQIKGIILPPLDFTVAGFAQAFPGTISFQPATVKAILHDLIQSLNQQGFTKIAIANSHLDPGHLQSLREADLKVTFPDLTRRKNAQRLTPEFQSGACHAGQFESSIVLRARPHLVKPHDLPDNPASLVDAIRKHKTTFAEAGGPQAYFGSPRLASAAEGEASLHTLGKILTEAIFQEHFRPDP